MSTHKGSWSASDAEGISIPADGSRAEISIQHTGSDPVYLGFGEKAVVGEGIMLSSSAAFLTISDWRACKAIRMVCASGKVATGGWQAA